MHLLATAQVQERNVDAAIKTLNQAIEIEPENPHLYLFFGFLVYYDKNDFKRSEAAYLKAISIDNTISESYEELISIYKNEKMLDKIEALLIALTKSPSNRTQKFLKLANFYEDQNQFKKAEETYLTLVRNSDKNNFTPLYNLGIFYARTKKYESAIDFFRKALSIKNDVDIRVDLANVYFEVKDLDKSEKQTSLILEQEPNNAKARLILSKILIDRKEYAEALEKLDQTIAMDKNNVSAYYLKAICLLQEDLGDLPGQTLRMAASFNVSETIWKQNQAITSLKTAIELSPNLFPARMLLAELYIKENTLSLAEKQIRYVLTHAPENLRAFFLLGELKITEKSWDSAEKIFQQIIDHIPEYSLAYVKLGVVYYSTDQIPRAIETFKKALDIEPLNMNALRYIVNISMSASQRDTALNLLNTHFKNPALTPMEKGYIEFLLGKIALSDKAIDDARTYFNKSIQTYDKTTPSYEALARLSG